MIILCACGCGKTLESLDERGRNRKYILRHFQRLRASEETKKKMSKSHKGKKNSLEHNKNISLAKQGEKSYQWKGDNVSYRSLHEWLTKRIPKPKKCQQCLEEEPESLANITGIYDRNPMNYAWFCWTCHNRYDKARRKVVCLVK